MSETQKPKGPPPVHPFDGVYVVLPPEPRKSIHTCKPPTRDDIEAGSLWGCSCGQVWRLLLAVPRSVEILETRDGWERVGWRARRRYWRRIRGGER